jgi:hypothetical protein
MAERARANRGKQKRAGRRRGKDDGSVGHNSGNGDAALQEITDRWLPKLQAKQIELEKASERASTIRGQLGALFKAAEADGLNRRGLRRGLELLRRDPTDVVAEEEQASRVLRVSGSILIEQYELFPLAKAVTPVNPFLAGQQAGREAAPRDPPYKPGSQEFETWLEGYDDGQKQNADKFREHNATMN